MIIFFFDKSSDYFLDFLISLSTYACTLGVSAFKPDLNLNLFEQIC